MTINPDDDMQWLEPVSNTGDVLLPVDPGAEVLSPIEPDLIQPVQPPAEVLSPNAPSGEVLTPVPCCWCKKYETDVNTHGSVYVLATQHPNFSIDYRLTVNMISLEVVVSTVLAWGTVDPTVTKAEQAAIRTSLLSAVPAFLSRKHKLEVKDPSCAPSTKQFNIRFEVLWNGTGGRSADLTVNLLKGPGRSGATGSYMNVHTTDTADAGFVLAHELMHTLGMVDEYPYSTPPPAISAEYHRADGTSTTIAIPQTGNIMSTHASTTVLKRHYWFIEIEAQKFLRSAAGLGRATIECKII